MMMLLHKFRRDRRSAYTLMELLVVIVIMIMLVAVTLPLAKRVLNDTHVREASRQLNAYFAMAKARATLTGRPCGLFLKCDKPLGYLDPPVASMTPPYVHIRQVTQIFLAEVPPPYSGSTTGALGRIMPSNTFAGTYEFNPVKIEIDQNGMAVLDPVTQEQSYIVDSVELQYLLQIPIIEIGEPFLVRFDFKGPWFRCQRIGPQLRFLGTTLNGSSVPFPPAFDKPNHKGYSYQIVRSPRKVGNPMELPTGTCIDMAYSGMSLASRGFFVDPPQTQPSDLQALTLMFSPSGAMDGIYVNTSTCTPLGTIHFLIGKVEKVDEPLLTNPGHVSGLNFFDKERSNLADPTSLWVSVGRTTGTVTSSDNAPGVPKAMINDYSPAGQAAFLATAREFATGHEQKGGR